MEHPDLLYMAIRAAVAAGKAIMDVYGDPAADFGVEMKQDDSPLTRADRASHDIIAAALSASPYPLLSEEGKEISFAERAGWETLWIVDPLDGTKEFIKKNGEFTVNIALVEKGTPVMGVIYVPVRRELYYGSADGAFKAADVDPGAAPSCGELADRALRLPLAGKHEGIVVVASRSHLTPETAAFIDRLGENGERVTTVSCGSSLKICAVAEGTADVYPRFAPTMEWDTAAGDAIARAANCTVCRADGTGALAYNKENLLNPWFIVRTESASQLF